MKSSAGYKQVSLQIKIDCMKELYNIYTSANMTLYMYSTSSSFGGGTSDKHLCSSLLILCNGRHSESVCGTWGELREGHAVGGCGCHSILVKRHQGLLRTDPFNTSRVCNLWNKNLYNNNFKPVLFHSTDLESVYWNRRWRRVVPL